MVPSYYQGGYETAVEDSQEFIAKLGNDLAFDLNSRVTGWTALSSLSIVQPLVVCPSSAVSLFQAFGDLPDCHLRLACGLSSGEICTWTSDTVASGALTEDRRLSSQFFYRSIKRSQLVVSEWRMHFDQLSLKQF